MKTRLGGQRCLLKPLFYFSFFFTTSFRFCKRPFLIDFDESVTDGRTDGQGLLQRCEDASKKEEKRETKKKQAQIQTKTDRHRQIQATTQTDPDTERYRYREIQIQIDTDTDRY